MKAIFVVRLERRLDQFSNQLWTITLRVLVFIFCLCVSHAIGVAKCPNQKKLSVKLQSSEFQLPGYDARRGLLAVRPMKTLSANQKRRHDIQVHWSSEDLHFSIHPSTFGMGLDSDEGILTLAVTGRSPETSAAQSPTAPCREMIPERVVLQRNGIELATVDLDKAKTTKDVGLQLTSKLRVERGQLDQKSIRSLTEHVAHQCAAMMDHRGATLQGALSIQLETTVLGEAMSPKTVVDGLVNRPYTQCLISSLGRHKKLWKRIQPGTRAYVTVYLLRSGTHEKETPGGQATD